MINFEEIKYDPEALMKTPYTRPQTGFKIEQADQFRSRTQNMASTLSTIKYTVKNFRRDRPKGFKDLQQLDNYLKSKRIEV